MYSFAVSLLCVFCVNAIMIVPPNPCPGILKYSQTGNALVGILELDNDFSGQYVLTVNGSLPYYDPSEQIKMSVKVLDFDKITMESTNRFKFIVKYASTKAFPKLTSVVFNGVEYCPSLPYTTGPGRGVTNLWANYWLRSTTLRNAPFSNYITTPEFIDNPFPNLNPTQTEQPYLQVNPPKPMESEHILRNNTSVEKIPTVSEMPQTSTLPSIDLAPYTSPTKAPSEASTTTANYTTEDWIKALDTFIAGNNNGPSAKIDVRQTFSCGEYLQTVQLVVSKNVVSEGELPWMSALYGYSKQSQSYQYLCTANLISKRHVITAGHCVQYENFPLHNAEELFVVLGKVNLENWARDSYLADVAEIHVHPNYKHQNDGHNLAMLTLKIPVELSDTIKPICLSDSPRNLDDLIRTGGTVAGWGRSVETQLRFNTEAKWAEIMVVSQEDCLRKNAAFSMITSEDSFCGGGKNSEGVCDGDAGAGFYVRSNGRMFLRGVSTFVLADKSGFCDVNSYSVFVDIAPSLNWINSIMTR